MKNTDINTDMRVPGCIGTGAANRSYPTSKVSVAAKRNYPMPRAGEAAERSYPMSEVGAAAERSCPTSKELQLCWRKRAQRSYSMFKVRRGDLVQGKEQWCALLEQP